MTAPRTWVTAELVSATIMNAHVRDMLNAISVSKALILGIGDFSGAPIGTGIKAYFSMPFAMRITGWELFADAVGSIVIDVWKDTFANFPPTVADSITGSEKPTLSSAQKAQDLTLSTWTTDLNLGDVVALNVSSASVVKQVTLTLRGVLLAMV